MKESVNKENTRAKLLQEVLDEAGLLVGSSVNFTTTIFDGI